MEKEQRSWLSRGGGRRRCRGGRVSGLDKLCQSCGDPLLFLGSLLMRRPPRPSLPSLISVCVVHLKERGMEKLEMRQMSGTKPLRPVSTAASFSSSGVPHCPLLPADNFGAVRCRRAPAPFFFSFLFSLFFFFTSSSTCNSACHIQPQIDYLNEHEQNLSSN